MYKIIKNNFSIEYLYDYVDVESLPSNIMMFSYNSYEIKNLFVSDVSDRRY